MSEKSAEAASSFSPPAEAEVKLTKAAGPSANSATAAATSRRWPAAFAALAARPAIEPFVFVALILLYIWIVRPGAAGGLKLPLLALILYIPFASSFLHRDGPRELGLRVDNFRASAREVALATIAGAALVLAIGALAGGRPRAGSGLAGSLIAHPLWALLQQYALQAFAYRRLRQSWDRPAPAAAVAAGLFAVVHLPNLALALATLAGGYVWCRLYERQPNLLTLALSHGWLAVLLSASWPAAWLHNLRIGPGYWSWTP